MTDTLLSCCIEDKKSEIIYDPALCAFKVVSHFGGAPTTANYICPKRKVPKEESQQSAESSSDYRQILVIRPEIWE